MINHYNNIEQSKQDEDTTLEDRMLLLRVVGEEVKKKEDAYHM